MSAAMDRFWNRVAAWQTRSPGTVLIASLVLAAALLPVVGKLGLNSAWTALLPSNAPSVEDLETIKDRFGGMSTLTVAVESKDHDAIERFVRDVAPKIEALGPPVRHVAWSVTPYEQFVEEHRHLYADLKTVEGVRNDLDARIQFEKATANPFYVSFEEDEPPTFDAIIERVKREGEQGAQTAFDRYPNGYLANSARDLYIVLIRTYLESDDVPGSVAFMERVQAVVDATKPAAYAPDLRVTLAGDVPESIEEHGAVEQELVIATVMTIVLVLLSVVAFFRKTRAVPLLALQLFPPVVVTFAIAQWTVHYLNTSTAFLGSIVVGNGVNPGIIWLARFFEERRTGVSLEASVAQTHRATWSATLTASLAAASAYGSLVITDFRGFRDFGIIGGVGMVLCWIGALFILPAGAVLWERWRPLPAVSGNAQHGVYGVVLERLVRSRPGAVWMGSVALGVIALIITGIAIASDPIEYDMTKLRSSRESTQATSDLNDRINEFMSRTQTGTVVAALAPSRDAAAEFERTLEADRDAGKASYGPVNTVFDLLPANQARKIAALGEIREQLLSVRDRLSEEDQKIIDEEIPPADLKPLTPDELPKALTAPFTEKDGTLGRIVVTEQSKPGLNWDGRYLVEWTKDVRARSLPDGSRPPVAGRPAVFADILDTIWRDGPLAIGVSFLATLVLVFLAFTEYRQRLLLLVSLLLGVLWLSGTMAVLGMKLNFLNFVAFPITFGIGVDYGVNVMRRYVSERAQGLGQHPAVGATVRGAGGAVALCSLTTIIGYLSLCVSGNLAIRSFGIAMSVSEVTCVASAVVSLPAFLLWRAGRRGRSSLAPQRASQSPAE